MELWRWCWYQLAGLLVDLARKLVELAGVLVKLAGLLVELGGILVELGGVLVEFALCPYINFDAKYRRIEKKSMKLPSEILAFKLLQKAKINHKEKLLVLTGMNYGNRKSMYEDSITSLKKFIGEQLSSEKLSCEIKLRKLVKNEEVLVATGTFKEQKKQFQKTKASCNQGGIGGKSGGWKMSPKTNRRRNRLDATGKILRCHSCGSFRHLLASCPDSWENMERVKVSKGEVLPKGYSWDRKTKLRGDRNNSAVFDYGFSSTECNISKRECNDSIEVHLDTKSEKEKSIQEFAKKYDESVKHKSQVKDVFNSKFRVKETFISKKTYKGKLKYRGAPEVETERGFEWKETDRNWKWHNEKQLSRNRKERMVVLATKAPALIYPKQEQRQTQEIQCKTINDIVTSDYIIRSSRCKGMGEDSKYMTQQQQKQKSRQQTKNNKEKENKGGHRIQERRRCKEAAKKIGNRQKKEETERESRTSYRE